MTTIIKSPTTTTTTAAAIRPSVEDVESNINQNKISSDWYYVKNNTPPKSPTKPQSSITPQPQIKFRSTKKSPSMSSINMAPAFNKISAPNEITKHEHYKQPNNLKTKETTGNEYFTCPVNGNNFMYNQIGIVNEQQYTKDQTSNFRQNQEYWQDIVDRSKDNNLNNNSHHNKNYHFERTDYNSIESPKKHQIENKFPSYSSGLSQNTNGPSSVYASHMKRIQQQPSPFSSPLMGYRRTMKFIQKRSDETSCGSSFEQLNIIGIPTSATGAVTQSATSSLQKQQKVAATQSPSSASSHNAINQSERQTNGNYDIQFGINSMERMKYSSEPKKRRPLPKLPIETMVSWNLLLYFHCVFNIYVIFIYYV